MNKKAESYFTWRGNMPKSEIAVLWEKNYILEPVMSEYDLYNPKQPIPSLPNTSQLTSYNT